MTWGTSPEQVVRVNGNVPDPASFPAGPKRRDAERKGPAERQNGEKSGRTRSGARRRRTRGGQHVTGHPEGGAATSGGNVEVDAETPSDSAGTARRRRRRRKPTDATTATTHAN